MIDVADQAVATSGGYGTGFDASGRHHHIFDPTTGTSARRYLDVTVIGPRATVADALSTALFVAPEARAEPLVQAFPGVYAIITDLDGSVRTIAGRGARLRSPGRTSPPRRARTDTTAP